MSTKSTAQVPTELQNKQPLSSEGIINKSSIDQSIPHFFPRLKFTDHNRWHINQPTNQTNKQSSNKPKNQKKCGLTLRTSVAFPAVVYRMNTYVHPRLEIMFMLDGGGARL